MTRLLGRVNIFDAAIALFVLALIPAAYASFLLFRTAKPIITSVEPAQLTYIEERASAGTQLSGKLKVHGHGLQPVLRASIGGQAAIAFIFETPESADVLFGELPPGEHDLILYDGVQEVARAPKAVTIPARSNTSAARMRVAGMLINLDEPTARGLRVGQAFPAGGRPDVELVALGELRPDLRRISEAKGTVSVVVEGRWQRPAAFVVSCDAAVPEECRVNGITLGLANRVMPVPGTAPPLALRIEEIVPAAPPRVANARVRFVIHPETAELLKVGDLDESAPVIDGRAASIAAIVSRQVVQGDTSVEGPPDANQSQSVMRGADRVALVDVDLQLGVDPVQVGFHYRTRPIAAGTALTFATGRYVMKGTVLTLSVRSSESSKP
jgi:hypothetical protein